MESETVDLVAPAHVHAGGWTASEVVSTAAGTLAHEFPDLPLGAVIAATVRTLHELRRVPLTELLDAPFAGVRELVEDQARHALTVRDNGSVLFSVDDLRVLRLLPGEMSFAEIAVALGRSTGEVKTRAIAIYRRLGGTSRADAVER